MQAWLSSQLRVVHIVADDLELATLRRHYAAHPQPDAGAGRARSPAVAQEGPDGMWQRVRETTAGGAILVRPDGHVGWRCSSGIMPDNSASPASLTSHCEVLTAALKCILCL